MHVAHCRLDRGEIEGGITIHHSLDAGVRRQKILNDKALKRRWVMGSLVASSSAHCFVTSVR